MLDSCRQRVGVGARSIHDILRSLGTHQRPEILGILGKIDKDLDNLSSEISSVKTRLLALNSRFEWLQKQRSAVHTLLSPIHRLPNELLMQLFTFACSKNNLECKNVNALNVAAVCHRWRELALSCSELWSRFEIWIPGGYLDKDDMYMSHAENRLDLFLSRSKSHPLTLTIAADESAEDLYPGHPLLLKVVESSSRWKHLTFQLWETGVESEGFTCLRYTTLTSLESFTLRTDVEPSESFWTNFPSSSLRAISTNSCLAALATVAHPSFTRVTSLIFSPDCHNLLAPLKWFPNLRHLGLRCDNLFEHDDPGSSMPPRSVPITSLDLRLRSLTQTAFSDDILGLALDSLTAPSLSALTVASDQCWYADETSPPESDFFEHIHKFLDHSGCSLTVLVLRNLSFPDRYVVDLLKRLGSLVELTLGDPNFSSENMLYPISNALIESLHSYRWSSFNQSFSPIVPKLRSLVLAVHSSTGFDSQTFTDTISSRWIPDKWYSEMIGVSCLQSVELHMPNPIAEIAALVDLEKAGMRVVVRDNRTYDADLEYDF